MSIKDSKFFAMPIRIPSIEEQQKIANFLSLIDQRIEKQRQLVESLKKYKRGLLSAIFEQKHRFKDENGNDYPEWNKCSMKDCVEFIRNGFSYEESFNNVKYIPISRIETIAERSIDMTRIGKAKPPVSEDYRLKKGDILFSNINSIKHIGKTAFFDIDDVLYHGMNLLCIRPNSTINNYFLFLLLNTKQIQKLNYQHAKQAVNQCSIPVSDILHYPIEVPSLQEQEKVVSLFRYYNFNLVKNEDYLLGLNIIKQGLLQQMFI